MKTHLTFLLWLTLGYIAYFAVVIGLDLLAIKIREQQQAKAKAQATEPDYKPVSTKIVRESANGKIEIVDAVPWHDFAIAAPDQLTLIIRADLESSTPSSTIQGLMSIVPNAKSDPAQCHNHGRKTKLS